MKINLHITTHNVYNPIISAFIAYICFFFFCCFVLFCLVLLVPLLCINHFESLFYTQVASVLRMQKWFDLHSEKKEEEPEEKTWSLRKSKRKAGAKNKIANHLVVNDHPSMTGCRKKYYN